MGKAHIRTHIIKKTELKKGQMKSLFRRDNSLLGIVDFKVTPAMSATLKAEEKQKELKK